MHGDCLNMLNSLGFLTQKSQGFKSGDVAGLSLSSNTSFKTLMGYVAVCAAALSCVK
jgi:hypothetical protein